MEASVGRFVDEWTVRANSARQDGDARILCGAPAAVEEAEAEEETADAAEPDEDGPRAEAPADHGARVAALGLDTRVARNGGDR
jgi:hypothetical protein